MKSVKIVVERHPDGYVAYPLGMEGVIVGEGSTYDEALTDVQSAIKFHIETFGVGTLVAQSRTPLTMPNHPTIKGATLRAILTQSRIAREEFLAAYEKVR